MAIAVNCSNISIHYDYECYGEQTLSPSDWRPPPQRLISEGTFDKIEIAFNLIIIPILSVLGIVVNTIIILVFYKQGYKDTINISLSVIAAWDLLNCICSVIYRTYAILRNVMFIPQDLAVTYNTIFGSFRYSNRYLFNASTILAAYVAVERCLCVCLPFNVKSLLTPKVVTCITISISTLGAALNYLFFGLLTKFIRVFDPRFNATVDGYINPYRNLVYLFGSLLRAVSFGITSISLFIQTVCFFVISYQLRKSGKFRSQIPKSTTDNAKKGMDHRDIQVTRMLLVVILVFIITFLPYAVLDAACIIEPKLLYNYKLVTLYHAGYYFGTALAQINTAISCFIYYSMSTKFKKTLRRMFGLKDKNM